MFRNGPKLRNSYSVSSKVYDPIQEFETTIFSSNLRSISRICSFRKEKVSIHFKDRRPDFSILRLRIVVDIGGGYWRFRIVVDIVVDFPVLDFETIIFSAKLRVLLPVFIAA